jgi:hypothetical protein
MDRAQKALMFTAMILLLLAAGCTDGAQEQTASTEADDLAADALIERISARIYDPVNPVDPDVVLALGDSTDDRMAWLVADSLRFVGRGAEFDALVTVGSELGGLELRPETAWLELNNHLLAEDRPAPPRYREHKRDLYVAVDATWAPFFADDDADIDWLDPQRDITHFVGGGHFEVQLGLCAGGETLDIFILHVSAIFAQMHGDAVCAGHFGL